jgi:hypothetical protein
MPLTMESFAGQNKINTLAGDPNKCDKRKQARACTLRWQAQVSHVHVGKDPSHVSGSGDGARSKSVDNVPSGAASFYGAQSVNILGCVRRLGCVHPNNKRTGCISHFVQPWMPRCRVARELSRSPRPPLAGVVRTARNVLRRCTSGHQDS